MLRDVGMIGTSNNRWRYMPRVVHGAELGNSSVTTLTGADYGLFLTISVDRKTVDEAILLRIAEGCMASTLLIVPAVS